MCEWMWHVMYVNLQSFEQPLSASPRQLVVNRLNSHFQLHLVSWWSIAWTATFSFTSSAAGPRNVFEKTLIDCWSCPQPCPVSKRSWFAISFWQCSSTGHKHTRGSALVSVNSLKCLWRCSIRYKLPSIWCCWSMSCWRQTAIALLLAVASFAATRAFLSEKLSSTLS